MMSISVTRGCCVDGSWSLEFMVYMVNGWVVVDCFWLLVFYGVYGVREGGNGIYGWWLWTLQRYDTPCSFSFSSYGTVLWGFLVWF